MGWSRSGTQYLYECLLHINHIPSSDFLNTALVFDVSVHSPSIVVVCGAVKMSWCLDSCLFRENLYLVPELKGYMDL
ncbi:hypothetical protein SERLA73DRAFT_131449 [Serpula lacrymans var. lacrymans S7.3]|uniref:Uncharacterized protein n=2 Tax=Serpula lacrymans var. lacrymans TaxID=341189 RepID=F8PN21_SERL3|nr:uncharacterized protein SERLADRAFT_380666 [Serpula lacrymans var. lacrymans S7.9]EGO03003.1 hypothetical protein SERLA73DRAFT_131449 [Serpula lacrymans var. lacrymans S7.3]EGO28683.1 hypothetical protein SERLADRAFT_380666 [Serpula lacrymans var. lacrymans S7.9]